MNGLRFLLGQRSKADCKQICSQQQLDHTQKTENWQVSRSHDETRGMRAFICLHCAYTAPAFPQRKDTREFQFSCLVDRFVTSEMWLEPGQLSTNVRWTLSAIVYRQKIKHDFLARILLIWSESCRFSWNCVFYFFKWAIPTDFYKILRKKDFKINFKSTITKL